MKAATPTPAPASTPTLRWAGDAAIVIEYGTAIDPELAHLAQAAATALEQSSLPWLVEAVPTYRSTLAVIRPGAVSPADAVRGIEQAIAVATAHAAAGRLVEIPVCYGGDLGPDLADVASHTGLSADEVVSLHSAPDYEVQMIGFMLGFPYLAGMDPRLATPRLTTPRTAIPQGSVGIAGPQTGVYPLASPGGWRIIGRTPLRLADPGSDPPCLLRAGDTVRFVPICESEFQHLSSGGDAR